MPKCSYEISARSAAPPERVYAILADAPNWKHWAPPFIRLSEFEREGTTRPGGVGAIRKLGAWPLYGREEIVVDDPPSHHAYTLLSGQPMRNYRADVYLTPDGSGTRITWGATFDPMIPGTGWLLVAQYKWFIGATARRLASEAEKS